METKEMDELDRVCKTFDIYIKKQKEKTKKKTKISYRRTIRRRAGKKRRKDGTKIRILLTHKCTHVTCPTADRCQRDDA